MLNLQAMHKTGSSIQKSPKLRRTFCTKFKTIDILLYYVLQQLDPADNSRSSDHHP